MRTTIEIKTVVCATFLLLLVRTQIVKLPLNPARIVFLSTDKIGNELNVSSFVIKAGLSDFMVGMIFAIALPIWMGTS